MRDFIEYKEGQKIGYHTFVRELERVVGSNKKTIRTAIFICGNCGEEFQSRINIHNLNQNKGCGCLGVSILKKGEFVKGFEVIKELDPYISPKGAKKRKYIFKCECGKEFESVIDKINSGKKKSCGCKTDKHKPLKHGLSYSKLYGVHKSMINRCYNENVKAYQFYGGKGVEVCNEWKKDFETFYYWALLNGWKEGLDIDRIDGNGNYEPDNCRFVPRIINSRNRNFKENKCGYTGVSKRGNRYRSHIGNGYKKVWLGTFDTPLEAVMARNKYIQDNNLIGFKIQTI